MMGNTTSNTQLYRRKMDNQGNYLPFPGYTMVAHALHPLPQPLTDLVNYLSSSELQRYYSFLPKTSYHVTINPIENVHNQHKSLLQSEQQKLKAVDTRTMCTARTLLCSKVILIEVEFNDDNNPNFQNIIQNVRSAELQQANILKNYTLSWHLTLAYQYRSPETHTIQTKLNEIISNIPQSSTFPFDISLDHIRICHYNDMTKFTPI